MTETGSEGDRGEGDNASCMMKETNNNNNNNNNVFIPILPG